MPGATTQNGNSNASSGERPSGFAPGIDPLPAYDFDHSGQHPVQPPSTQPAAGQKRTHEDAGLDYTPGPSFPAEDVISETCQQVRGKAHRFLATKGMTKTAFSKEIEVSMTALNRFLERHGSMEGKDCAAYPACYAFFKLREAQGKPAPPKKMPKQTSKDDASGKAKDAQPPDLSAVHLDGEDKDKVPVYETCDDVRKHITAYLRKPHVTLAQLTRDLLAQFHVGKRGTSATQLGSFRGKRGPANGNTSPVFYAAYVFFEKLRIMEGKPKSARRVKMEEIWGEKGGFDVTTPSNKSITMRQGDRAWTDEYGELRIMGADGKMVC